jgi:hypothetical protein
MDTRGPRRFSRGIYREADRHTGRTTSILRPVKSRAEEL